MNNQIPYGFMPPFNFEQSEIRQLSDRINNLDKKIGRLEKRIEIIENNNSFRPFPNFPNNMQ